LSEFTHNLTISKHFTISNKLTIIYKNRNRKIEKELEETWKINNYIKNELIKNNIIVVGVDHDEFLFNENLLNYIENAKICSVSTNFNVVQLGNESAINWELPILKQRSMWNYIEYNNKPCIIKGKMIDWMTGRHNNTKYTNDKELICLHLRDVDYARLYTNVQKTKDLYTNYISDHRSFWNDEKSFDTWFKIESIKNSEKIPENILNNCLLNSITL
jgi:hypothetical protein